MDAVRRLADSPAVFFSAAFLYVLSITLLRPSPYQVIGPMYGFVQGAIWAAIPVIAGVLAGSPRAFVAGTVLAALGPFHTITAAVLLFAAVFLSTRALAGRASAWRIHWIRFTGRPLLWFVLLLFYLAALWLVRMGDASDALSFPLFFIGFFPAPVFAALVSAIRFSGADISWLRRRAVLSAGALLAAILVFPLCAASPMLYAYALEPLQKLFPTLVTISFPPFPLPDMLRPYDFNWGSLASAHFSAVIMAFLASGLAFAAAIGKRPLLVIPAVFAAVACLMGENLHMIPGLVAGLAVACIVLLLKSAARKPMFTAVVVVAVIAASVAGLAAALYSRGAEYGDTRKAELFRAAIRHGKAEPVRAFFGEGPGSFASRAADMRLPAAYSDIESNIPRRFEAVNPRYRDALLPVLAVPMWQPPLLVPMYSTMGRAMSGVLAVLAEFGIPGVVLLLAGMTGVIALLAGRMHRAAPDDRTWAAVALTALVCVSVTSLFRQYPEYPDVALAVCMTVVLAVLHPESRLHEAHAAR